MFTNMTIGKKLMGGFMALLVCMLGLSYAALSSITTLRDSIDETANRTAKKVVLAGGINESIATLRAEARGMVLATATKNKQDVAASRSGFDKGVLSLEGALKELRALLVTERGKKLVADLESGLGAWKEAFVEMTQLCEASQLDAAEQVRKGKQLTVATEMSRMADEIMTLQNELLNAAATQGGESAARSIWVVGSCIGIALVLGVAVIFTVRGISHSLRQAIGELSESAGQVASAAGQISSSSQSLAQGSSEQAASLEETSASSEEINSMARKNAENSQSAAGLVLQSQQKFAETNQSLQKMVGAMSDINASSDKVSKIIKVIDEIAFQTNILALNAAVEAARAGEAGMGFAVVADEVRNLAQRCAQAAKDTAALIEESITKSNDGKTKVDQVAVAIRAITEESAKVKTLVDEVSLGSQEQTRGIEQVAKALTQMEQVTQQSAANAEESAAAAEELTAQSAALMEIVGQLGGMVGGTEAPAKHPVVRSHRTASSSLQALKQAVSGKQRTPASRPGPEPHTTAGPAIPMEEEFKEMV